MPHALQKLSRREGEPKGGWRTLLLVCTLSRIMRWLSVKQYLTSVCGTLNGIIEISDTTARSTCVCRHDHNRDTA